ncbi:hypothetical protein VNO77_18197 [Canavalia gladiata]|uniref:Uncharacterized protein n=1 Tax=Canavalia gladiata TaxID=3824 RepID=A0AAN9LNQ7_CANGL
MTLMNYVAYTSLPVLGKLKNTSPNFMVPRQTWIYHKLESSFKFLALDPRAYFDKTEGRGLILRYWPLCPSQTSILAKGYIRFIIVGVAYTLTPISNWFEKLLVEIHSLIQEGNSYSACLTKD